MKRKASIRARVIQRDGLKCAECGKRCQKPKPAAWGSRRKNSAQVDHRLPLWVGGKDTLKNCRVLCDACHAIKTSREATLRAKARRKSAKFGRHREVMFSKFPAVFERDKP